jgi:hypothetical protein
VDGDASARALDSIPSEVMPATTTSTPVLAQPNHLLVTAPDAGESSARAHPQSRRKGGTPGHKSRPFKPQSYPRPASPQGLPTGFLFVLALYGSLALLNLGSTLATFSRGWQQFMEFIFGGLF